MEFGQKKTPAAPKVGKPKVEPKPAATGPAASRLDDQEAAPPVAAGPGFLRKHPWMRAALAADPSQGPVQAKKVRGEAGDPFERHADQVAAQALALPAAPAAATVGGSSDAGGPGAPPVGGGPQPLPAAVRERVEPILGADLGHVRVHTDGESRSAAARVGAKAFTHGSDIFVGPRQDPGDVALMAHEATHVVQQAAGGTPAIQKSDDEDAVEPVDPADVVAEETDDLGIVETRHRDFAFRLHPDTPDADLFLVPATSSRADVAARLFGNEALVGEFDFVPIQPIAWIPLMFEGMDAATRGEPQPSAGDVRAVRARNSASLVPAALEALRVSLDRALTSDIDWTIAKLSEAIIDDEDERLLAERTLRWSQRSEMFDASGTSYFDRFLGLLRARELVQPLWYTATISETRRTALDWLVIETESRSEQVRKAIELRSRRFSTGYTVTDSRPEFSLGDVIGRFYWSDGSTVQIQVAGRMVSETTRERAELATRNAPWTGMKVVVPSGGRFIGYAARFAPILGLTHPMEDPGGRYYWYHPGTVFIRGGEYTSDVVTGTEARQQQRRNILANALADSMSGDVTPLIGLDFDVLALLDPTERAHVFRLIFSGPAINEAAGVALLSRVIMSTPDGDFRRFERQLMALGMIQRLLGSNAETKFMVGQAFTAKALAVFPVSLGDLESMPSFQVGKQDDTTHMIDVPSTEVQTELVAPEAWDPAQGVSLASEPAGPGETPGLAPRTALAFKPVTNSGFTNDVGPVSRNFHPLELVRLDILGPEPDTRVVTAIELACIVSVSNIELLVESFTKIIEMHLWYGAFRGVGQAFGPAFTRALLGGGLRAALGALATTAGTQAGRLALRQFAVQALLLSSMAIVNSHRDELRRTPEGRAFLGVFDVSMLMLAGHGIYRLASSGALRQLAVRGLALVRAAGTGLRMTVVEAIEAIRAADIAWMRMREARQLVVETTAPGVRSLVPAPGHEQTFRHVFFSVRADLAGQRALNAMSGAAIPTETALSIFRRLQELAAGSDEIARGYAALARRAAAMPAAEIEGYLTAAEALRAARPTASTALGEFLRASGSARVTADPTGLLNNARWLASIPQVSDEALGVMASKARTKALDLAWLRGTSLTPQEMNFLGLDSKTPWNQFKAAAAIPAERFALGTATKAELALQVQARARLRGIAGELVSEQRAAEIFPHHRIAGRQVRMGRSVIDYVVEATDGTALRHAAEVKGWDPTKWRNALNAWLARQSELTTAGAPATAVDDVKALATALTEEQMGLVKQLKGVVTQLNDAAAGARGNPFLIVTQDLSGPTKEKLLAFLRRHAPTVELKFIPEADILEAARGLRVRLGLPELPRPVPRGGTGGTPGETPPVP